MFSSGTTYEQSGVNIDAGERFARMIKERVGKAWPGTAKEIGGFAGGGPIPARRRSLKASTDGAGTKALLAAMTGRLEGIGIDAVAMSAVDTYVSGARPAYLLDVLDVGHLNPDVHIAIIDGIIKGCIQSGCRLIGGETAEQSDMFRYSWMFSLSTMVIGFPDPLLRPARIRPGQTVWGWPSKGPGSNGFSLIRRSLGLTNARQFFVHPQKRALFSQEQIIGMLLEPTPIWIREIDKEIARGVRFTGHAHITGSGMPGNIPRILPSDCKVVIDRAAWERPPVFRYVQWAGQITDDEMDRVFNQGIMVVSIVDPSGKQPKNPEMRKIGEVVARKKGEKQVVFKNKFLDALQ